MLGKHEADFRALCGRLNLPFKAGTLTTPAFTFVPVDRTEQFIYIAERQDIYVAPLPCGRADATLIVLCNKVVPCAVVAEYEEAMTETLEDYEAAMDSTSANLLHDLYKQLECQRDYLKAARN